jgi:hypothetical protein
VQAGEVVTLVISGMSSSIQLQIGYLVIPHSTKLLLFIQLKISTRYPHFEDSAGIGKIFSG